MIKHYKITVHGIVQGVFYRKNAKKKADELGIKGFVQNQVDGTVYIEAEGSEEQLKQLVDWCHQGPDEAKVHRVKIKKGLIKGYDDFSVNYKE